MRVIPSVDKTTLNQIHHVRFRDERLKSVLPTYLEFSVCGCILVTAEWSHGCQLVAMEQWMWYTEV